MRIAIEAQRIFRRNKHGMDVVALEIIRHLQRHDKKNEYYILVAPGEDVCLHSSDNVHVMTLSCPTYPLWEQVALPLAVRRIKPDLLHCTSNTAPLFCPAKLVLTLHDIIYLEPRQQSSQSVYQNLGWYYRRFIVPRILPRCSKIITVSEFERQRIQQVLGLDTDTLIAIHNGFGTHFKPVPNPETITRNYLREPRYILFLGNTDPKKNTQRTLKAYGMYVQQAANPLPLLVADLPDVFLEKVIAEIQMPFLKAHLRTTGYIANTDLPAIYSGAAAFLYTSLRESFGIPLLEAMACGTPVITSATSSMPEVAGDAALFANPFDEKDMADRLISLLSDETLRYELIAKGMERANLFSWEQTALKTYAVYEEVVHKTKNK